MCARRPVSDSMILRFLVVTGVDLPLGSPRFSSTMLPRNKKIGCLGWKVMVNKTRRFFQKLPNGVDDRHSYQLMAKKNKDQVPNVNSVTNRDIIQRLSFLYQASTYLNAISSSPTSTSSTIPSTSNATTHDPTKKKRRRTRVTTQDLSKSYITSMKIVGQKTTVKMCVLLISVFYSS